jgi:hypothetical protein
VTSTLAKGAVTMSGRRVIVKRLEAIQNFGAMDVLCVDKTVSVRQSHLDGEEYVRDDSVHQGTRWTLWKWSSVGCVASTMGS